MTSLRARLPAIIPVVTTIVALLSMVFGLIAIQLVLRSSGHPSAESPEFFLWSVLVAASAVVFGFVFVHSRDLAAGWRRITGTPFPFPISAYVLVAMLTIGPIWIVGRGIAQLHPHTAVWVSRALATVGIIAAGPAVIGLWLIYARLRDVALAFGDEVVHDGQDGRVVLADLLECRRALSRCISSMSVIVTAAVITAADQRAAFLSQNPADKVFPTASVLLYGATFTAVFALIYIPALLAWRARCAQYVDAIYALPADGQPTEDWVSGRGRLAGVLGSGSGVAANLKNGFAIIAPLATSVLSILAPDLNLQA